MTDSSVQIPREGPNPDLESSSGSQRIDELRREIEHAAHLLPSQGPITVFVHHNTLHAFEDRPFESGVVEGGRWYGCHAFLPEEDYQSFLKQGRIRLSDLEAVLIDDLGDEADRLVSLFGTRYALRLAVLQFPLQTGSPNELRWFIAETDALRRFRQEVDVSVRDGMIRETRDWVLRALETGASSRELFSSTVLSEVLELFDLGGIDSWSEQTWEALTLNYLWRVCRNSVLAVQDITPHPSESEAELQRHRDLLLKATGVDCDLPVHELLIAFCSAFLDQGFSEWELPHREQGFYRAFLNLYDQTLTSATPWISAIRREARRLVQSGITPLQSIDESLQWLGVSEEEQQPFITRTLMALRGWSGMIWQMETNAEWTLHPAPSGSLTEYLAIRLMLDRLSVRQTARQELGYDGPLDGVRQAARQRICRDESNSLERRTFTLFQLAQVRGWNPHDLEQMSPAQWNVLLEEIESFSALERRKLYHLAYERKYRNETLDAILIHTERLRLSSSDKTLHHEDGRKASGQRPAYQVVCCIDDREESFRRHLEEIDPSCETFGLAGFFGVAMYYRGVGEAHFKPLCPVSIKPRHYVIEEPLYSFLQGERRRAEARRRIGRVTHQAHRGTRTFLGGLITGLFGSFAAVPLVTRVLFPRTTSQIRKMISQIVRTPATELRLERTEAEPGPEGGHIGYTIEEMADIVSGGLHAIGLLEPEQFSPLLVFCGHGSSSLNNPHESAYNCGACSGSQGGPNARAFAQMANDLRVRQILKQRGLAIPEETFFIGAYHNTCDDSITWYDLDRVPIRHRPLFEHIRKSLDEARKRDAHERCRRFESAELVLSFDDALNHVEARAEDLSQARPEYNHATNALCFVGQRAWSRGLFLDRRAFLTSYDPAKDDQRGSILESLLQAVIPVCAGINLEYYFSTVDVEGYGCGSKLPHNITSLLGVMTGAASDLKPGLSAQMVEIHEPIRILFVIETTESIMQRIIDENEGIARLVKGNWVQLALFEPAKGLIRHYQRGKFVRYEKESQELPIVHSSSAWYSGQRHHLGFASILPDKTSLTNIPEADAS